MNFSESPHISSVLSWKNVSTNILLIPFASYLRAISTQQPSATKTSGDPMSLGIPCKDPCQRMCWQPWGRETSFCDICVAENIGKTHSNKYHAKFIFFKHMINTYVVASLLATEVMIELITQWIMIDLKRAGMTLFILCLLLFGASQFLSMIILRI